MKDTQLELDDAAQQLFQQLGGIAERADHSAPSGTNGLSESHQRTEETGYLPIAAHRLCAFAGDLF
jgi:hypothetical protein